MERIIIGIFIIITGFTISAKAQQDSVKQRNARESTKPLPINKGSDHSKVLLDTSFNPGTEKGDSLMYRDKKKTGKQKKVPEKGNPPGIQQKKTQLQDTTYRVK